MWIGTNNGLNRYDGHELRRYAGEKNIKTPSGFQGRIITTLHEDQEKNLWVGTRKSGINFKSIHSDQFVNFNNHEAFASIKGAEITKIYQGKENEIWVATLGKGLLKYNTLDQVSTLYNVEQSGLQNDIVFDMIYDNNEDLWVTTAGTGIHFLNEDGKFQTIDAALEDDSNMDGFRKSLLIDKDILWIGTEGSGLYQMDLKTKAFSKFKEGGDLENLSSNLVKDLCLSPEGSIYVATDGGGLNIVNPKTRAVSKYLKNNKGDYNLNSNALQCFFLDKENTLWIGTFNGGLNILTSNKTWFELYTPQSQYSENTSHSILGITETEDGTLWVGTDGSGMFELKKTDEGFASREFAYDYKQPNGIGGNIVKTIFEDSKNNLWIGMYGTGLDLYDRNSNSFEHFTYNPADPYSISSNNVWAISEGKEGNLWIGTIGQGINIYNPQNKKFRNHLNDPFLKELGFEVMALLIDHNNIFIGDQNNGLLVLNTTDNSIQKFVHKIDDPSSISNNEIRCIYKSSKGELWIGTEGGGLNKWNGDGTFERILRNDGLIANSVMGVTEDEAGNLWISTFKGISQMNPVTMEIINFSFHTRKNNQFNQMAIYTCSEGQLYFGGINGLNFLRPSGLNRRKEKDKITFTSLLVNNEEIISKPKILSESIELSEQINLDYDAKSFSLKFTDFNYSKSEEQQFQYRLDGFDKSWNELARNEYSINYTNISPGNYTLEVKNDNTSKKIGINIKAPFWDTLLFKSLLALLIIGSVFIAIYIYNQRTKENHKRELLNAEQEILQLKNENLAAEVNIKNSKLLFSSTQMAHKNEILSSVKEDLKEIISNPEANIRKTIRKLDRELESEDYWKEFNVYFNQVDANYIDALLAKHPNLTQNDIRLCGLLKLNLSTKEIAILLNVSVRGVEKSKYRLKKRLILNSDQDLLGYIRGF